MEQLVPAAVVVQEGIGLVVRRAVTRDPQSAAPERHAEGFDRRFDAGFDVTAARVDQHDLAACWHGNPDQVLVRGDVGGSAPDQRLVAVPDPRRPVESGDPGAVVADDPDIAGGHGDASGPLRDAPFRRSSAWKIARLRRSRFRGIGRGAVSKRFPRPVSR